MQPAPWPQSAQSRQFPETHATRRKINNQLATAVITLAALVGVSALLLILGYVVWRGAPAINIAFFTERPLPYGEEGGGVAPAILGTLVMLAVAAVLSLPIGIGTAIYLSEFGRGSLARI